MINEKIAIRLMFLMDSLFLTDSPRLNFLRKPYGIMRLLLNIVDKVKVDTTTIEIAAENPPKNPSKANDELP